METRTALSRIFLTLVCSTSASVFAQNRVIKVGGSCLNLHASASMHSWTKDCLSTGTVVKILGTRKVNGARYVKVSVDGQTGYVWNTYLHAAPAPAAATAATLANRTTYLPGVASVVPPLAGSPVAPGLVQTAAYTPSSAALGTQVPLTNPYLQTPATQPTQSPLASALPLLGAAMNMMGGNSNSNNSNNNSNNNSSPSRTIADTNSSPTYNSPPSEEPAPSDTTSKRQSDEKVAMDIPGARSEMAGSKKADAPEFTAPADVKAVQKTNACRGATATRLALAVLYKSCQAAATGQDRRLDDVCDNDITKVQYRASTGPNQRNCGMGSGAPFYSQSGARVSVSRHTVSYPGNHTDCSGFVCGTLARAGQNIFPGRPCTNTNTGDMLSWASKNSCFEVVRDGKLQEGDIIVGRQGSHGHTGRICGQSGDSLTPTSKYSNLRICHAASPGMGILNQPFERLAGWGLFSVALRYPGHGGYVLRHVGNKKRGCMNTNPIQFQGESCVKSCPNINPAIQTQAI